MSGLPSQGYLKRREAEAIIAATRRNSVVQAGAGSRVSTYPNGTIIETPRPRALDYPRRAKTPFQIYNASSGATLKVGVYKGYVNGVMPTLGGTALDNATPPTATITATTWVWLKCVATFGAPDTYVVTVETTTANSPPTAEAITGTGFTSCLLIGIATVSGGVITNVGPEVFYNLGVESYGNVNSWWALK